MVCGPHPAAPVGRRSRPARATVHHQRLGRVLGAATPPCPARRMGQAPALGAGLCARPQGHRPPDRDPADGPPALPAPASRAVSLPCCRACPTPRGRQRPALCHGAARPHRYRGVRPARGHRPAHPCTGRAGPRRGRSRRRLAHHPPPYVSHGAWSAAASDHPAGAGAVCGAAPPRLSHPATPQLLRLRAGEAVPRLYGPGHVGAALPPDGLAATTRSPWAPLTRCSPPLCRPDAGALGSGGRRGQPARARTLD
jgi:hypothetical protein